MKTKLEAKEAFKKEGRSMFPLRKGSSAISKAIKKANRESEEDSKWYPQLGSENYKKPVYGRTYKGKDEIKK